MTRIFNWIRYIVPIFYRNKLNANPVKCFAFFLLSSALLFAFFSLIIGYLGLPLSRDRIISRWTMLILVPIFFSLKNLVSFIFYDYHTNRLGKKIKKYNGLKIKKVDDLLKLLTIDHFSMTIERASLNLQLLKSLQEFIHDNKIKKVIHNIIEFYETRLNNFSIQFKSVSICQKKYFLRGHNDVDENKMNYLTNQLNRVRRRIRVVLIEI